MNEKINKLQELFDSLESWAHSAEATGLKCEKFIEEIKLHLPNFISAEIKEN